ncbi:hypothetical protein ACXY7D_14990 [Sphingomonas melonis]
MDVFFARPAVRLGQLTAKQIAEPGDDRRREPSIAGVELPFEDGDVGLGAGLLRTDVAEFAGDLRIVRAQRLIPDQPDYAGALAIELGQPGA